MDYLFPKENRMNIREWMVLAISTALFFIMLYISYAYILLDMNITFTLDLNILKVTISVIATSLIFLSVNQFSERPSTFFFNLFFYITYIPMAVIYGCCNYSTLFFLIISFLSYGAVCILNRIGENPHRIIEIHNMNHIIMLVCISIVSFIMLYSVFRFGLPSLDAANLDNVYELRRNSSYLDNKYFGYIFKWAIVVILPFIFVVSLHRGQVLIAGIIIVFDLMIFLYSGQKTVLFSLPLTLIVYIFSKIKNMNVKFYSCFSWGILGVIGIAFLGIKPPYSYLVRRVMLLPAKLKFLYFDFFSTHPKIGLAGTLWGSLLGKTSPYSRGVGYEISSYYFKNDAMNSNTGFIAEGYYRFGIIGLLIAMGLFLFVLYAIDGLAERSSYALGVSACVYSIYTLNDGALIDSLIFGPMLIMTLITLFFTERSMKERYNERKINIQLR